MRNQDGDPRVACHSDADIEAILNHLLFFC